MQDINEHRFYGPKYLKGSDKRINFLSCKYIRPCKEGIVERISGQTTEEAIRILKKIWQQHPFTGSVKKWIMIVLLVLT